VKVEVVSGFDDLALLLVFANPGHAGEAHGLPRGAWIPPTKHRAATRSPSLKVSSAVMRMSGKSANGNERKSDGFAP
jgi:hypothetical protein